MAMSGNFVMGAMMTNAKRVRGSCACDGQFSESKTCRRYQDWFLNTTRPDDAPGGFCGGIFSSAYPGIEPFAFGKRHMEPWLGEEDLGANIDWKPISCADPNHRGLFLLLQGGLHWKCNATETFRIMVEPVLDHPKYRQCAEMGKVRLVWVGLTAQSRSLDKLYPHQSRENAIEFNKEIESLFRAKDKVGRGIGTPVTFVDWWNLTANSQTSDGLHSLTDVNMAKAAHILQLAEMLR